MTNIFLPGKIILLFLLLTGERRIRVHTLSLPITSKLSDVYAYSDQEAIVNTLSKLGKYVCFNLYKLLIYSLQTLTLKLVIVFKSLSNFRLLACLIKSCWMFHV